MNPFYEVFTAFKQGLPVLKTDLLPNAIFEFGEPVRTLSGLNGFVMEVSKDGEKGVIDVSPSNVYSGLTIVGGIREVGANIYYNSATGTLTTSQLGTVFAVAVRSDLDVVQPVNGTYPVSMLLVNNR